MSTAKKEMPDGAALAPYDTVEFLRTPEQIAAYLEAVFEDYGDDSRVIVAALGDAARAQGMLKIADETGLNREGLYKTLSGKGNPSFDTVLKVMKAVGVELRPKVRASRKRPVGLGFRLGSGRKRIAQKKAPTRKSA